ncbi:MAG: glycosyltransferase [Promethearchaeota archaeon]
MTISTLNPVSIVVPIKNRSNLLLNLIKNLSKLDYPEYEIIIVDDFSKDNTKNLLDNYPVKTIRLLKSVGSAEARNIGIRNAKYNIIAITDSDCIVSRSWLKDLVPYLNRYDVVGGKVIFCNNSEKKLNPFNYNKEMVITRDSPLNFLNTSNMLFYKKTWKSSGGFQNFRIEDLEFSWRLIKKGFKLIYSPKGTVIHYDNRNPIQTIKKYLQYGKSYTKIGFIYNMSFPFKTDRVLSKSSILNYLQLISLPFIFLLASILISFTILNLILNISLNLFSSLVMFFLILRQLRRLDILFRIYKFTIIFAIINYSLIYITKKKFLQNPKRVYII